MINLEALTQYFTMLVAVIGVLAFVVSIVVEVVKGVSIFEKMPTDILVVLLSLIVAILAMFVYASYASTNITWLLLVAAIFLGFFVAFVAMYGWTKFNEMWARLNPNNNK